MMGRHIDLQAVRLFAREAVLAWRDGDVDQHNEAMAALERALGTTIPARRNTSSELGHG
ncbi:MAG TPA: hypothetical protein VIJ52_08215 [Pseudolabrys sp.]